MKISQKFLILFLLNAIIPVLLVSGFSYFNTRRSLNSQIDTQINNTADRQVASIQKALENDLTTLNAFPVVVDTIIKAQDYFQDPTPARQEALNQALDNTARFQTGYRRLHLLTVDGVVVASTDRSSIGKGYKDTPVFKLREQAPDVSQFSTDADGQLVHYAIDRMRANGGTFAYALLEIPPATYAQITRDYADLGKTGETLLLGKGSDGGYRYLLPTRFNNTIALQSYDSTKAAAGKDYRDHGVLSVQRDIPNTPWRIVVKMDEAEVFLPVYQLRDLTIIISVSMAVVVLVLGLFFSKRITSPIIRFTDVVKRIRGGNHSLRVPVVSKDEIGTLSLAFNDMTNELAESNRQLEVKVAQRTEQLNQKITELSSSKAKDDAILDSIGDGMIVTDNTGSVLFINTIAADFLGVDRASMLYAPVTTVVLYSERGTPIPAQEQPVHVALQTKQKVELTVWTHGHEGKNMTVAVTATPVLQQGKVMGTIQILRDVTKEKEIDRMKTEFISLASHQLRTPLSAIKWFSEMLLNGDAGKLSGDQQGFTQNIADSTERMIELVRSLLNISRIESGRIIIDPKPTDLKKMVEELAVELQVKVKEKKQHLALSVHNELPLVNIDPQLTRQIYLNLLTNAIKYTPEGGEINVLISRNGDDILSQVTDNGYGIPKAQQDKVFQKFFRAENITKVITDGTGLGLYLIKAIVDSQQGKIWFESEEGQGTSFWFTLPVKGAIAKEGEVTIEESSSAPQPDQSST